MLSDEEKKAIEKLSSKKNETTWNDTIRQIKREEIKDVVVTRQKYITLVLNLIKKQSKEIEELKEKNKFLNWYFENQKENFIHKDKIKAKIEEIDKVLNEDIYVIDGHYDDRYYRYLQDKKVLQSLLEKE